MACNPNATSESEIYKIWYEEAMRECETLRKENKAMEEAIVMLWSTIFNIKSNILTLNLKVRNDPSIAKFITKL